jgi:hypothetical protein
MPDVSQLFNSRPEHFLACDAGVSTLFPRLGYLINTNQTEN